MSKDPTEKQIENAILDYLALLPGTYWKCNNVGLWDSNKKVYRQPGRHFRHGTSDILGIMGDGSGRLVAIEVKTKKGRLSEYQKQFLEDINKHGGIGFVARSLDEVRERLVGQEN